MQKQIASYLFLHKVCPLPGLGTLSITGSEAAYDFSSKVFTAPKPAIYFEQAETDASGLLNYISSKTGGDKDASTEALTRFCSDLKRKIADETEVHLSSVGSFVVDASGAISFKQDDLPAIFMQPVFAERVIHPDAEHQILVGDKETTNTLMTELLAPKSETKDRWWIWAILLGMIGIAAIVIYFTQFNGTAAFGNAVNYIHS